MRFRFLYALSVFLFSWMKKWQKLIYFLRS